MPDQAQSGGDWFSQNAPSATAPPPSSKAPPKKEGGDGGNADAGGDWFSANAPAAAKPKPLFSGSVSKYGFNIGPPPETQTGAYQTGPQAPVQNYLQPDRVDNGVPHFTQRAGETVDQTMQRAREWAASNPDAAQHGMQLEHHKNVHETVPLMAAGAATALLGPEAGVAAKMGMAGLGAASGEAGTQLVEHATGDPLAPKTTEEAATPIVEKGVGYATAEGLGVAATKIAKPLVKRYLNPVGQAVEDIFRASGPPSAPGFRENLEIAAQDIGRAYKAMPIPEGAKGGFINPDMRVRNAVNALNNQLRTMYQLERAAQVGQASKMGATIQIDMDQKVLADVAKRMSGTIAVDDPSIPVIAKLMENPKAALSVEETDALARSVNTVLRPFEKMTDVQRAAAGITSRKFSGLKQLDKSLSVGLNTKLREVGLPGLESYERRYAAVSQIRDALQSQMNPAEAKRWEGRIREFFTPGGGVRAGVSSAIPKGSPGKMVERGMKTLAKDASPQPTIPPPPTPHGLLPAPPTPAGWTPPPTPTSGPPRVWTDAERASMFRQMAEGIPSPPPNAAGSVEVTRPEMKLREGGTPSQVAASKVGPQGKAGTRTPIKGYLPAPPVTEPPPPTSQVGAPPGPPSGEYRVPGVQDNPMWTGTDRMRQSPPEAWSKSASKPPLFYRSEAAPLARKHGLIPREPSAPGLVSFQDSTTGGSIEMKEGFSEQQLAEKVKAHREAMAATPASGKSDLQKVKRDAAASRFAHETAPASGLVKSEFGKLKVYDLVTPRQQKTLETMMKGPQWSDMEAADRQQAIRRILGKEKVEF